MNKAAATSSILDEKAMILSIYGIDIDQSPCEELKVAFNQHSSIQSNNKAVETISELER